MRADRSTHPPVLPLALALAAQVLCAWVIGGRLHPDETHQYLEFAHRVAWGYSNRPHEFYSGMRNLAAPGLLAGVLSLARALGLDDPRSWASRRSPSRGASTPSCASGRTTPCGRASRR